MPRSLLCLLAMIGLPGVACAADVTVVIDFDGPHSDSSVQQMKRETEDIFKSAGVHLEWRRRGDVGLASYENLVVVHFKGKCVLEPVPILYDERGPFAFAYNSDGEVLPFSEVECDRLTASVHSAMRGDDFARPNYLMGRALGRVVAHELVHILTRSASHSREGVTQAALSGPELIGAPLRLSRGDLDRLRRAVDGKPAPVAASEGEPKR